MNDRVLSASLFDLNERRELSIRLLMPASTASTSLSVAFLTFSFNYLRSPLFGICIAGSPGSVTVHDEDFCRREPKSAEARD